MVDKGTNFIERYFNEFFSVFKHEKPSNKKEIKSSLSYSKFWAGLVNLMCIFIDEGLDWNQVRTELENIKNNVMQLRNLKDYTEPLFKPKDPKIPDSSHSPKKVGNFLNANRKQPVSIQDIN